MLRLFGQFVSFNAGRTPRTLYLAQTPRQPQQLLRADSVLFFLGSSAPCIGPSQALLCPRQCHRICLGVATPSRSMRIPSAPSLRCPGLPMALLGSGRFCPWNAGSVRAAAMCVLFLLFPWGLAHAGYRVYVQVIFGGGEYMNEYF